MLSVKLFIPEKNMILMIKESFMLLLHQCC